MIINVLSLYLEYDEVLNIYVTQTQPLLIANNSNIKTEFGMNSTDTKTETLLVSNHNNTKTEISVNMNIINANINSINDEENKTQTLLFSNKSNVIFQQYLHNIINNKTIYCNSSHFKYIELLMNDIKIHMNTFKFKWNSSLITTALAQNTKFVFPTKTLRLKYVNNTLYIHKPYGYKGNGWPKKYCTFFVTYFWLFTQKYKGSIPSFDILIYVMDDLHYHYNFVRHYNRMVPVFVSDSYSDTYTNVLFHTLSRSIVKSKYYKIDRFLTQVYPTDYRLYKNISFQDKIDKVLFRGSMTNNMRDSAIYELNYNNLSSYAFDSTFIDAKLVNPNYVPREIKTPTKCTNTTDKCWIFNETLHMPEAEQEKYKYIIVIDGITTRDAFALQMPYNSVKLKYKSDIFEFWYYDLIHNENILYWNSTIDLMNLINDLYQNRNDIYYNHTIDIESIAMNSVKYARTHFDEASLDCFTLHMLNIYNKYFFNASEIELDKNDTVVDYQAHLRFLNENINIDTLLKATINIY